MRYSVLFSPGAGKNSSISVVAVVLAKVIRPGRQHGVIVLVLQFPRFNCITIGVLQRLARVYERANGSDIGRSHGKVASSSAFELSSPATGALERQILLLAMKPLGLRPMHKCVTAVQLLAEKRR